MAAVAVRSRHARLAVRRSEWRWPRWSPTVATSIPGTAGSAAIRSGSIALTASPISLSRIRTAPNTIASRSPPRRARPGIAWQRGPPRVVVSRGGRRGIASASTSAPMGLGVSVGTTSTGAPSRSVSSRWRAARTTSPTPSSRPTRGSMSVRGVSSPRRRCRTRARCGRPLAPPRSTIARRPRRRRCPGLHGEQQGSALRDAWIPRLLGRRGRSHQGEDGVGHQVLLQRPTSPKRPAVNIAYAGAESSGTSNTTIPAVQLPGASSIVVNVCPPSSAP